MPPALPLPPCPPVLVSGGAPLFGLWQGAFDDASFRALGPPFRRNLIARKLVEKQWVYALVSSPEAFLCIAIVDAGVLHSGFLGLFDRRARKLLVDETPVLPPIMAAISEQPRDCSAQLAFPANHASIDRSGIKAAWGKVSVDLRFDFTRAPPPASACADLGRGRFDFTQKQPGLLASGVAVVAGRTLHFERAFAGLDFTHGYLRRKTEWRWAFATGRSGERDVAFNFSEGFLGKGSSENVLWVDGVPRSVGEVEFVFDRHDPRAPWSLRSHDGGVELEFTPEGHRAQDVSLGLMMSRYVQPFGVFRGHVEDQSGARLAIERLAGVTEDHAARW